MTRDEKIEAIHDACLKAIPSEHRWLVDNRLHSSQGGDKCMYCGAWESEPHEPCRKVASMICLTDVLLAAYRLPFEVLADGTLINAGASRSRSTSHWDLRNDSLDEQSDDCLTFLYDLLCAT